MKVVAFIEPPQPDVIEAILNGHQSGAMVGGLWPSRSASAPPEANELVLELDAAFVDSSLESADQAEPSQELTYVDIDTFLANFSRILDARQQGTPRPSREITLYFAFIDTYFLFRKACISLTIAKHGRSACVQRRPRPPLHTRTP